MRIFSLPVMRWLIIIAAILLWANAYTSVFKMQEISLPVEITGLPENLAVANTDLSVTARMSGQLFDLKRMPTGIIRFEARLSENITAGEQEVEISLINNSPKVSVASFTPATLKLVIEDKVEKTVPILVAPKGMPADSFSVKNVSAEPSSATISGARSLVAGISEVTADVEIARRSKNFTAPAALHAEVAGRKLNTVSISPANTNVSVEIVAGATFRNLGLRAAFTGELPGGFRVQEVKISPATLLVQGTAGDLAKLTHLSTTPIDLTGRNRSFAERVAVDLPNGIDTPEENLVSAEVIVISEDNARQFQVLPKFVNVTEGFSVTSALPGSLSVVVSGEPSLISRLSRTDIVLNIDLAGSLSGTNTVKITDSMFSLPNGISLASFTPAEVEVVLTRQQ